MESSSSIREPSFCRIMNRADELLMGIPSEAAAKMWGGDKGPTNVLIETDDGRTFVVFISAASGKFFLFKGWSDVVTHLRLQSGALVIPECILPKSHDYTRTDLISTIHLCNKTFHVKIETVGGKACFTNGIDVIVSLYRLEAGCYFFFTKWFGYSFHLTIFGKNGVEMKFDEYMSTSLLLLNKKVDVIFVLFRLPDDVSAKAKLRLSLKNITIRLMHVSPPIEFTNGTRRETKEKGYGYALKRWSTCMNTAGIEVGDMVYFCFDELEQVLIVERVVPHVRRWFTTF
ncbi:putative DNA-binding pseudobarrel domain superfamily [Helianthus annuus]|uniref:DNA-binding pseudobarrel domain superfamily n=1 Tax=Helianthus annuus TaxID=4232 RepID=A0A9K3MXN4_HELAN|nr:putative DNA-binding pseudobarrel domain superfamily [Helianthus annuus]KAJ0490837.1 putative DNA-binding pseudobarrel domain superfamily [Helianthus annuus]KAJ0495158.1 putative DNA-binding pseudobarrel domain superfamily [Helianthus annuus]KAJ0506742.1 putative DNA-binding pseudobarrel domain superfamily [Helianthus annuus]KAJ0676422.1 putative DNA-binding pseudobarrel domain superfamily [Helianthus annuus]